MFGKNPRRKVEHLADDGKIAVQEIFYTIQGEGPFSGMPAVFIRLAGCHLACTFCDTEFESRINDRLSIEEITARVDNVVPSTLPRKPLVVMTGGEPLRQTTGPLVQELYGEGYTLIQYETAGNLWDASLENYIKAGCLELVTSPKTPHVHPLVQRYCKHYKYVLSHDQVNAVDGLPSGSTQSPACGQPWRPWDVKEGVHGITSTIWVSPCDAHDEAVTQKNTNAAAITCMHHGYRLSLQTHKILNLP